MAQDLSNSNLEHLAVKGLRTSLFRPDSYRVVSSSSDGRSKSRDVASFRCETVLRSRHIQRELSAKMRGSKYTACVSDTEHEPSRIAAHWRHSSHVVWLWNKSRDDDDDDDVDYLYISLGGICRDIVSFVMAHLRSDLHRFPDSQLH